MAFDKQSNGRRIEVDRSYNHCITKTFLHDDRPFVHVDDLQRRQLGVGLRHHTTVGHSPTSLVTACVYWYLKSNKVSKSKGAREVE